MKDCLEDIYTHFRPLLGELSKLNIDYSKDMSDAEIEIFEKWMKENINEQFLERACLKDFFYDVLLKSNWAKDRGIQEESYYEKNIKAFLEDYGHEHKKEGVVWILAGSGSKWEGSTIESSGIPDRFANSNFENLLETLQFPVEIRKIFIKPKKTKPKKAKPKKTKQERQSYRFNALKEPEEFLERINQQRMGCICNDEEIIEEFCKKSSLEEQYEELKTLIKLWIKKQSDDYIDQEIDYKKYLETIQLFEKLIPTVSEDGRVKTLVQYEQEKVIIEQALYNYYKDKTWGRIDGYLQEFDKNGAFTKRIEEVIDLIHCSHFNEMQKDFLTAQFIDGFYEDSERFIDASRKFQRICEEYTLPDADFEYYQNMWSKCIS